MRDSNRRFAEYFYVITKQIVVVLVDAAVERVLDWDNAMTHSVAGYGVEYFCERLTRLDFHILGKELLGRFVAESSSSALEGNSCFSIFHTHLGLEIITPLGTYLHF